jgi:hypothetical protein
LSDHLTTRALNRATLARQHLLGRSSIPVPDMIDHLVGMQAQNPLDPYYGLWARIDGFEPGELSTMIEHRSAVRTAFLRATIHLVTSRDLLVLDKTIRPVSTRVFNSTSFARDVAGMEMDELIAAGRKILDEKPRSRADLSKLLADIWPDRDPQSMAMAVTYNLALVQVPPRGLWEGKGVAKWATVQTWLGAEIDGKPAPDLLALRYLAALGPATTADMRTWSGVTGLGGIFDRLGAQLRTFRDDEGRVLFDLPDAPRPGPDIPAPPRFLPEYDNVLLGHADRSRVIGPDARPPGWAGNLLHDGFLVASWKLDRAKAGARIEIRPFRAMGKRAAAEVGDEAARLLEQIAPGQENQVGFGSPS